MPASACVPARQSQRPPSTPMPCWRLEKRNGTVFVREKIEPAGKRAAGKARGPSGKPERVVIVGGGAAGFAAGEMLRRGRVFGRRGAPPPPQAAPPDPPPLLHSQPPQHHPPPPTTPPHP